MGMLQEITSEYRYLNSGPLFHIATFMTTLATFHFGGTNVFTRRVDAEELCRLIETEQCTGAFVMGPTIKQILDINKDGRYNLKSLRTFGGKPEWNEMITVDTSPWARKPAGYGQTEAAQDLCKGIAAKNKQHFSAKGVGHYGIFSGRKYREIVYPRIREFIGKHA